MLKQLHIATVFPSQLSKYKNIKISFLEQILILCENSCNKNSSKIISILDGTNAISKLKIFPQTNYICRILTNEIFFTELYNFHSVQHSHYLQFHIWVQPTSWGLT